MTKRIEGLQDASLELGMPVLPPDLQEYVDRHPWPSVRAMREFVAKQLVKTTEVPDG